MKCECVLYKNGRLCHKNAKTQDHYADDDAKPAELVRQNTMCTSPDQLIHHVPLSPD